MRHHQIHDGGAELADDLEQVVHGQESDRDAPLVDHRQGAVPPSQAPRRYCAGGSSPRSLICFAAASAISVTILGVSFGSKVSLTPDQISLSSASE